MWALLLAFRATGGVRRGVIAAVAKVGVAIAALPMRNMLSRDRVPTHPALAWR